MPQMIKDGTGNGYLAKVNSSLKLDTSSRSNDRIYYASREDGKAFIIQWEFSQASGGASEGVGYLTYTGSDRINIKQISFSTEDAGLTKYGLWKNPTTLSGGLDATPINLNFSSNNSLNMTSKSNSDGTAVTITGGDSLFTVRTSGPDTKIVSFFDAIILGTNDTIAVKGSASTTGSKIRINIMFAEAIE